MSFVVHTTKIKHSINKLQKSIKTIVALTKFFYNYRNINSIITNSKLALLWLLYLGIRFSVIIKPKTTTLKQFTKRKEERFESILNINIENNFVVDYHVQVY